MFVIRIRFFFASNPWVSWSASLLGIVGGEATFLMPRFFLLPDGVGRVTGSWQDCRSGSNLSWNPLILLPSCHALSNFYSNFIGMFSENVTLSRFFILGSNPFFLKILTLSRFFPGCLEGVAGSWTKHILNLKSIFLLPSHMGIVGSRFAGECGERSHPYNLPLLPTALSCERVTGSWEKRKISLEGFASRRCRSLNFRPSFCLKSYNTFSLMSHSPEI